MVRQADTALEQQAAYQILARPHVRINEYERIPTYVPTEDEENQNETYLDISGCKKRVSAPGSQSTEEEGVYHLMCMLGACNVHDINNYVY